jgi:replication factor A1
MDLEKIVKKIAGESGLEEKEIKDRIENKQKELGGLITSEGAAHVVANEVGINLFEGVAKTHDLNIENIIPDMNSVDVVGRVLRIYGPREFDKKDGSKGKVCSLVLGDGTGTIRTVFWGKDTGLIEEGKIVEDSIIRIKRGYTKENINGEAEIHIGTKTRVILNPKDVRQEDIPLPEERKKKIAELEDGMSSVDVVGRVLRIYEPREFEREDKTIGKVVNLVVGDETGRARVVFWDEDVGLIEKDEVKEGDILKIKKGYVRVRYDEPEINVGKYGKVILNPPEIEIKEIPDLNEYKVEIQRKEIEELKEGDRAEIRGALVEIYDNITVFDKKDGKGKGMVINAVIDDGTASMRAAFYDKMAETLMNIPLQRVVEEDVSELISDRRKELLGKEIIATVSVRHSDFSGKDELVVQDIDLNVDPKEEVRRLLKEAKSRVE